MNTYTRKLFEVIHLFKITVKLTGLPLMAPSVTYSVCKLLMNFDNVVVQKHVLRQNRFCVNRCCWLTK